MTQRAVLVLVIVAAMATVQLVASFATGPRTSQPAAQVSSRTSQGQAPQLSSAGVALADNGSDNGSSDNGSNDNSSDNGSSDNSSDNGGSDNSSDNSSDNGSSDNSSDNGSDNGSNDNGSDNGSASSSTGNPDEIIDNVAPTSAAPVATPTTSTTARTDSAPSASAPAAASSPSPAPVTEVSATASGIDSTLALPGNRVSVQIPAAMPQGTVLTLKMVDPLSLPPTTGIRAGDLIFQLTATDATGATLTTLPAEVTLTVTYADRDVIGLNEAGITLGHLDPVDNTWKASSRQVANADANTVSSPVTDTGAYAVYVP